ncbi:MAG: M48 family metallopeptidase [Deltaproteobacteria bacterium]|nr:M48 family metallopeptidase [Deltaproteobacteria bacterium]
MEFQPRAPREGINVSHEHPLKEASILIVGLTMVIGIAAVVLVFFVDLVVTVIPAEAEARALSSWIPDNLDLLSGEKQERVEQLVDRLASHWPECPYTFRVGVFGADQPNALALPGGLILVTTKLLEDVESENELALVLGHEIGHYRDRDHIKIFGRSFALSLLLAVTLGRSSQGLELGTQVTGLAVNSFSREQESKADQVGLALVQAEYGHVADSWKFFERMAAEENDLTRLTTYLSTHPASGDRSQRIRQIAEENGWPLEGPITPWQSSEE